MKRMKVLIYLYDQKTAMNLTGKRTVCCGEFIVIDKIHSDKTKKLFKAGKLPSIYTKLSKCRERGDTWSEVCRRISLSIDLVASDAINHQQCKSNFLTKMKDVPGQEQSGKIYERPFNKPMVESFKTFCYWRERQTELYTIAEVREKLWTFAENDVYSIKWPKKKAEITLCRFKFLC